MQKEIFEGRYTVYSDGRVYSNIMNKFLKHIIVKDGVHKFRLLESKDKAKMFSIHRLVALTFIPNIENKPQVDHIDGDKSNNDISNLRWCTNSENQNFRDEQGNSGKEQISKKIKWGDDTYNSIRELSRHIADLRGSKVETIRKELKTLRYCSKVMYGKYAEIIS